MQLNNSYKIYNASAGSGKTFSLVKEYLILLLTSENNDAYKNILSITFTNKAVNEMKSRIVDRLIEFSDKEKINKNSAIIKEIIKETTLSVNNINIKSNQILKHLLKNYAAFEISTIDKFTQRIVRSFSYELNIDAKYEVEIDEEEVLNKAVDKLISKAGEDSELTKIFIDYAFEKADNDKSWDISLDFRKIAKALINENSYEIIKGMQQNSVAEFVSVKQHLKLLKNTETDNCSALAQKALSLIESNRIDHKSFIRQSLPKHFNKIINKNYERLYNNTLESNLDAGNLYSTKIEKSQKDLIDAIQIDLCDIFTKIKAKVFKIKLYDNLLKNITPLSILNAINDELTTLKADNNTMLISEFNKIINEEIKNQPAPFIYEKIGCKYKNYFIDEFQDTSNLQWENLIPLLQNSLSSENSSLTIAGDAKQSIYRWRGSQVERFIGLINKNNPFFIDKDLINLPVNYRSNKKIIEFNNDFFNHIASFVFRNEYFKQTYLESSQNIFQKKEGYVNITLINQEKKEEKAELYCVKILEIINSCIKNGYKLKDICIIVRKRKAVEQSNGTFKI
ncbi:MAG TPA: UvrD-helicase domain-containing protein, partial [Flavobacteriaceae bacterium]|nr:UvrD-helicase domain-containing protein [Flavobacteriaceae bacterium]